MRKLLATLSVLSIVSLTACGGGAASSGVGGGSSAPRKADKNAEVDAARAEAEAQEKRLSELRAEKAELEALLEGKAAPAASTPAPAAAPAPAADTAKAAPAAKPAAKKGK